MKTAERLYRLTGMAREPRHSGLSPEEAVAYIERTAGQIDELSNDLTAMRERRDSYVELLNKLEPFRNLEFSIKTVSELDYIKCRFGKMPASSFKQFETYLYHEPEILFTFGKNDGEYIWGAYFVCGFLFDKFESVFSSLHFEAIDFPYSIEGDVFDDSPGVVYEKYSIFLQKLNNRIKQTEVRMMQKAGASTQSIVDNNKIAEAYVKIKELFVSYDARKYAAKTKNDYYILVGWMTEKEAKRFAKAVEGDDDVVFIIEDKNDAITSKPPTKLRNLPFVRPFEFFVRMYGLPSYGEIEPTLFVALTYTALFGIMFGDVGQGAVIALIGFYLGKIRRVALGKVMFIIGLSSMMFGFLFGSLFGMEVLPPLLLSPGRFENINTLLIGAIIIGVGLIFTTMALNIANTLKRGRGFEVLFDPNGVAGLAFYGIVLTVAALAVIKKLPVPWYAVVIAIAALLVIGLRQPIAEKLRGEKKVVKGGIGIFLFETFIEIFEVVLSYFTNTVSFVRVGAFAISHASLMSVVRMLAGSEAGSPKYIIVMIFGNMLVMGLEGLIVGIQALRIEFYEIFSRFYEGKGREFVPFNAKSRQS
jgi:V/A-type H+-transporting ATPase subunit I